MMRKARSVDGEEAVAWKRTHEKVVGLRTLAADVEKLKQIPELPMDVATYLVQTQCQYVITRIVKSTVTGESTTWTFPSSIKISLALRQSCLTSSSVIGSQRWS